MDGPKGYYAKLNNSDKDKYHIISFIYGIFLISKHNKQKQICRYREQTDGCQKWGGLRWANKWKRLRDIDFQLQNK